MESMHVFTAVTLQLGTFLQIFTLQIICSFKCQAAIRHM